ISSCISSILSKFTYLASTSACSKNSFVSCSIVVTDITSFGCNDITSSISGLFAFPTSGRPLKRYGSSLYVIGTLIKSRSNSCIISSTATVVSMSRWSSGSLSSFTLSAVALSSEEQQAIKNSKLSIAITLIIIPFLLISLPPPDRIYYSETQEVLLPV